MLAVLLVVAVNAALFFVVGVPVALCLRAATSGWASFIVDALVAGLILVTIAITLGAWFGWPGPVLVGLVWAGAIVTAVVKRAGFPARTRLVGRDRWLALAWAAVIVAAVALRLRSVNFLPWVGDMGAYVNWANEFALTGKLTASWPPLFSSYLAVSAKIFGTAFTTAGVPLLGILLVLVVARVTRALGAGKWATLITAAAVTLSVHAIWYSSFPASESLNAPLFVAWIGSLIGVLYSVGRRRVAWLIATGASMLSLGMVRGDGPILLAPFALLAILSIVVPDWRLLSRRLWLAFAASSAGALVTYWYGIQQIPRYYVETQVKGLMPGPVFRAVQHAGLFAPSIVTALILIAVVALLCAVGLWLARRYEPRVRETRAPRILGYVLGATLVVIVLANVFLGAAAHLLGSGVTVTTTGEVWQVMLRAGLWLTIALVFLVFFAGRAKLSSTVTALVLFLGTIAAFFLALQSYRLKVQRVHSFYLYWDRYLVSEYIPVLFVVLGLALTVVWTLWAREWTVRLRASTRPGFRALPAIVATLLALAAVVPTLPQLVLVEKDTFMAGAYQFDHDLAALVPSASDKVIWSASRAYASPAVVPGFVFPNTWMAFAKPMTRTFGLDVVDLDNRSDTRPDEVLTATMLEQQAACSSATSFVVFESELGGPALDSRVTTPGITFTALGSKRSDISLLSQPPKNGDWTHFRLTVRAWTVTIDPTLVSAVSCPTK